jgi:hypothetical protein
MEKFLLSLIPYAIIFAFVYGTAGVLLFKNRDLKGPDDLWAKKKAEILDPAFRVAFTICIIFCAYRCIRIGHLTPADRLFALFWGLWSVVAHKELYDKKK